MIQTDLSFIASDADRKADENQQFIQLLKTLNGHAVDEKVALLNAEVEPQIDCTMCGNCCKTLMINVEAWEADRLSKHLKMDRDVFDERYLEKSEHSERMLINTMPCHFLSENKCTVYPYRFAGCREFPALDKPLFTKRLFTIFMHYGRCPIIYNVVEKLKEEFGNLNADY
ncbi:MULTISPECIES: YkgJ family cysteine cluster protein [Chitinophagaceae]